ncbi:MAG: GntR family transcriptional regulator [Ilumatobacteraceae bacterium]
MTSPRRPDRNSPLPLWAQVLDDLRRRLAAGEFADGFPADRELTDEYGVSRHTARDAVRRLQEAGLLQRERGRGTFLRPDAIEQGTGVLYSLFQSVEDAGYEQRSDVRALEVTHDAQAALRLDLPDDAELIRLEQARFIDRDPVATTNCSSRRSRPRPARRRFRANRPLHRAGTPLRHPSGARQRADPSRRRRRGHGSIVRHRSRRSVVRRRTGHVRGDSHSRSGEPSSAATATPS